MADASTLRPSEAARRYAGALFELAQDTGQLADVHRDFSAFAALVRDNGELDRLIASPAYSRDEKTEALTAIVDKAGLGALMRKFIGTMAQNGRARDIPAAQRAFDQLYARQRGVKRGIVRTARPMTDAQRTRLEDVLAKAVGGEVELSEEVDEALIGGIQLRLGSTLIDASLAAKLNAMNSAMKGA